MWFKLVLTFSGLVAFVPLRDDCNRQTCPERIQAIFIEARTPRLASDGSILPAHLPFIRVDEENYDDEESTIEPGESFLLNRRERDHEIVWFLNQDNITITKNSEAEGTLSEFEIVDFPLRRLPANARIPSPENEANLSWLAKIDEVLGGGEIHPEFLKDKPLGGVLAARVNIDNGRVMADNFERNGFVDIFRFQSLTSAVPVSATGRALAGSLRVEINVPGCSVSLNANRFTADDKPRRMVLKPVNCDAGGEEVHLKFGNQSLEDILGLSLSHGSHVQDKHFEIFYDLLKDPPPGRSRPVPIVVASERVQQDRQEPFGKFKIQATTIEYSDTRTDDFRCPGLMVNPPQD